MVDGKTNGWGEWGRHVLKTLEDYDISLKNKVDNATCKERIANIERFIEAAEKAASEAKTAASTTLWFVIGNILVVIAVGYLLHIQ